MKNFLATFSARIAVLTILFLPSVALAQQNDPSTLLQGVGEPLGANTQAELPEIIGNLINVLISVLGIIFVVLTVYAGYLYLTAQGDDKKVDKAKHMLAQAVIGLVIILAAYGIAKFVIDQLGGVTAP